MSTFTFLHISDLHISRFPSLKQIHKRSPGNYYDAIRNGLYAASHSRAKLARLASFINNHRVRLDAVIITGDIATTGLTVDLDDALAFVAGTPGGSGFLTSGGLPTIGGLGLPTFLLPGNHDRYRPFLGRLGYSPGGRDFHRVFGGFWADDVRTFTRHRDGHSVAVIAADVSLRQTRDCERPRLWNKYAQGMVYPDVLERLRAETETFHSAADAPSVVLWALHFPPAFPGIGPDMKLLEEDSLIKAANELGVAAVLAGHTHEPSVYRRPNMLFDVYCAGTATQFDLPTYNHCQIITVETSAEGSWLQVEHYKFDKNMGGFVPV